MTKRESISYGRIYGVELVTMSYSAINFVAFLARELYYMYVTGQPVM